MFSVTLTVAPPEIVTLPVWPAAAPICRPELLLSALFGLVRARVPPVMDAAPFWTLSWFMVPPPKRVSGPADVLIRLLVPGPPIAPLIVKPPVPAPATVTFGVASVEDRLTGAATTMLPAP